MKELRKKATLYKAEPVLLFEAGARSTNSISKIVNESMARYQHLLINSESSLTNKELEIIRSIYQENTLIIGLTEVCDFLKDKKNSFLLAEKIENLSLLEKYKIIEDIEKNSAVPYF